MSTIYIQIPWSGSNEYLDVDLDQLPTRGKALETLDYLHKENEQVRYVARCEMVSMTGKTLTMKLRYLPENNKHIVNLSSAWGDSTIEIDLSKRRATATWRDNSDRFRNGVVVCRILDDSISNDVSYRSTRSIDRLGQAFVRQTLLQKFGRCALTGERTRAVLDVAHLLAASDCGAASIKNCILLRADIHRLMDNGLLSIDRNGKVTLRKEASPRYQKELSNSSLSPQVLAHVKQALITIDEDRRT